MGWIRYYDDNEITQCNTCGGTGYQIQTDDRFPPYIKCKNKNCNGGNITSETISQEEMDRREQAAYDKYIKDLAEQVSKYLKDNQNV